MIFLSRDFAEAALQPYFDVFLREADGAWQDWMNNPLAPQLQHKRVRAACVWNQFVARSRRAFDGSANVRVQAMKEYEGLLVEGKIFLRFKKGSRDLISRNYPTDLALAYNDQGQDLFPGISRLELVYVLDPSETKIDRLCVVQRHRNQIVWWLDVKGQADDGAQNVLPFAPVEPSDQPVAQRVLKSKVKKQERGDGKKQFDGAS